MDDVENRLQRERVGSKWAGEKYMRPMRPRPGKQERCKMVQSITIRNPHGNPYLSIRSAAQRLWLREKSLLRKFVNDCGCASGTPGKGFCMSNVPASDISGCNLV